MNHNDLSARTQLASASRLRDQSLRSTVLLTAVAVILCGVVAAAAADYLVLLPRAVRWLAWITLAVAAGLGIRQFLRQRKRPTSMKEAALELESAAPQAGCEVSTAAEYLSGQRRPAQDYESELVGALEQRAAAVLQQAALPYTQRIRTPAVVAGAGLLTLLGFWLVVPAAGTALRRTVVPWSSAVFSRVEVSPGSVELPVGQDLVVTNVFRGRVPSQATLAWREEGRTEWSQDVLRREADGTFRHAFNNVRQSFVYRVSGSDAVSAEFAVTAYVPPAVKDLRIGVKPPAYTGLKAAEFGSPDLSVVRGSTARFQVSATTPLKNARLHFTNETVLELSPASGERWTAEFSVLRDATYRIELTDAAGHRGTDQTWHTLTAIADDAPKVEILEPGGDMRSAGTNTIPLKIAASDDFGLTEVRVVYHRLGDPERTAILKPQFGTNHEARADFALNLAELDLRDYQIVAYHAEATDNNTYDGPGVGRSPVYFIEINHLETKPSPKKPGKPGEKVNLLMVQKQIIADTTALAGRPGSGQAAEFDELASRQTDAQALGEIYQTELAKQGAPFAAQGAIHQALTAMNEAAAKLREHRRDAALPREEAALASLYLVLKHMPQLKDLPLVPPAKAPEDPEQKLSPLAVVLEAIRKRNQSEPNQAEFARALAEMQTLLAQQSKLSTACVNPGDAPSDGQTGPTPSLARPLVDQAKSNAPGAGKGQGQGKGQAKEGEAKPGQPETKPDADLAKLAPEEERVSQEAKALADRLAGLAGKTSRQAAKAGKQMGEAAGKLATAAKAMKGGDRPGAGSASDQGSAAMGSAIASLERLLKGKPELGDVVAEEAPTQYEGAISDYFRRLSHAQ